MSEFIIPETLIVNLKAYFRSIMSDHDFKRFLPLSKEIHTEVAIERGNQTMLDLLAGFRPCPDLGRVFFINQPVWDFIQLDDDHLLHLEILDRLLQRFVKASYEADLHNKSWAEYEERKKEEGSSPPRRLAVPNPTEEGYYSQYVRDILDYVNAAFRRHNFPYQFVSPDLPSVLKALASGESELPTLGKLLPLTDDYLEAEVQATTLNILHESPLFAPVLEEFDKALSKYHEGDWDGSIVEASKALESTFKIILERVSSKPEPKLTSKKLLSKLKKEGFFLPNSSNPIEKFTDLLDLHSGWRGTHAAHGKGSGVNPLGEPEAKLVLAYIGGSIEYCVKTYRIRQSSPSLPQE